MHFKKLVTHIRTAALTVLLAGLTAGNVPAQDSPTGQTLQEQLEATNTRFSSQMPAEVLQTIDDAVRQVADSGVPDRVIKVGDKAPDFELPDATGQSVRLSDLLAEGPVVLTWYRGNW